MNHERIHARQQQELLIVFFYVWYLLEYSILRLFMNHHSAYRNIVFEREAYAMEHDVNYLKKRRFFNFIMYYNKTYKW